MVLVSTAAFYALQFTTDATIHWDAVDVHYSSQAYLSDQLRAGHVPFWTPQLFSGFPFLADPQVGAWYPLNWPFLLAGITPRSIEAELALHTLLACVGTYLFTLPLLENRHASVAAALWYGLSGFFAAHSEHVGMLQAASWLPWLLLGVRALSQRPTRRRIAALAVAEATMLLAGHFQTALYVTTAAGLYAVALILQQPRRRGALIAACSLAALLSVGLASVEFLPGLQLARESVRATLDATGLRAGFLQPEGLLTLLWPDALGALGFGNQGYWGPTDVSQFYWYGGVLLVPAAALGAARWRGRWLGLLLIVPFAWYAIGPSGGLYTLVAVLPGFHSIQEPVNGWFLVAFGLALLAGGGVSWLLGHLRWRPLAFILLLVSVIDLVFWNSVVNALAYRRASPEQAYLAPLHAASRQLATVAGPDVRVYVPPGLRIGYLNGWLQLPVASTDGYNPLELTGYAEYITAIERNPRLIDGLAARYVITPSADQQAFTIDPHPNALPLAAFAKSIVVTQSAEREVAALDETDPATQTLVRDSVPVGTPDPNATVDVVESTPSAVRLRYRTANDSLLRLAIPWFPGWQVTVAGHPVATLPVDHAFLGAVLPAGEGEVLVAYTPRLFWLGLLLSLASLVSVACLALPALSGLSPLARWRPPIRWSGVGGSAVQSDYGAGD